MRRPLAAAVVAVLAAPGAASAGPGMVGDGYVVAALSDFVFRSTAGNVLAALAFGGVVFLAATKALRARNIRKIRTRLEPHVTSRDEESEDARERLEFLNGFFEASERVFSRVGIWRKLMMALERADSPMRPAKFFYVTLASAFAPASFVTLIGAPAALAAVGFLVGAVLPIALLARKARRRQNAFDDQLADVLMTMASSMRAGHTFRQAMQAIVEEEEGPASKEFKRVMVEIGIGRPVDQALHDMAARIRSRNFDYVISVVSVQREVGGSLAGLFDMVSGTVRHRQQFTRKVKALTAMGRVSAYILTVMPFFIGAIVAVMNPSYIAPLFTTSAGHVLIVVALVLMALGGLILRKIVSFRMA